jgi:tetratricopeptide (TPR) repeat protein
MKNIFTVVLLAGLSVWCFGQDNFAMGEDLFMQNKPREAAVYFENTIAQDPAQVMAHLYLGIAYEQMNRIDEAITVYRQVLGRAGDLTANIANNLGNAYFRKGSTVEAEAFFSQALEADRVYASAYLGRANTRIQRGALGDAVADYEQYLLLEPRSPQRASIERLVALIKAEFAEAERQRLVAQEMARLEAERRQRLLDEVAASLQSAAGASQGLSAGAEDVEGYEGAFELE